LVENTSKGYVALAMNGKEASALYDVMLSCRAAKSHGLPVSLQVFALTSRSHGGS
jgi:hypothetical protein